MEDWEAGGDRARFCSLGGCGGGGVHRCIIMYSFMKHPDIWGSLNSLLISGLTLIVPYRTPNCALSDLIPAMSHMTPGGGWDF